MAVVRRIFGSAVLAFVAFGTLSLTAQAGAPAKAPRVFQVSPTKVNLHVQKNILLLGQNLTPATRVTVGGHPAATVEAPDPYHLLVKLPEDLSAGRYTLVAANEAGSTTVDEPLIVQSDTGLSQMNLLLGGGFLALVVLVARMAKTPVLG